MYSMKIFVLTIESIWMHSLKNSNLSGWIRSRISRCSYWRLRPRQNAWTWRPSGMCKSCNYSSWLIDLNFKNFLEIILTGRFGYKKGLHLHWSYLQHWSSCGCFAIEIERPTKRYGCYRFAELPRVPDCR